MATSLYLGKSRIRQELLGILFASPERSYYLSELSRKVSTSPGNAQRELNKFIEDGLLRMEKKGNLNFYQVNSQHPLYEELKTLISKTVGVENHLEELVNRYPEISFAMLYGSFAKGKENGASDIDLLVVAKKELKGFYSEIRKLEKKMQRDINPTLYSPQEWAKKIQSENRFLSHVLQQPHKVLKGNFSRVS